MDNIFLSGQSALALLLSPKMKLFDEAYERKLYINRSDQNFMAYLNGLVELPPLVSVHKAVPRIRLSEARALANDLRTELPLQSVVSTKVVRRNSKYLHCSVLPLSVQTGCFFKVSDGFYCATPEMALLSVTTKLTDIELVVLMSLMFGIFTKDQETGKLLPRRSLSSPELVLSFLDRCGKTGLKFPDGAARLRELAPRAIAKAASPKEIESALRLGCFFDQGGCGFGLPEMNYRLSIPSTKRNRYCDLYWPEQNVAVEYQGAEEHASLDALEADALHNNDLTSIDVPAFTLTANQLANLTLFNRAARQIGRRLGAPKIPSDAAFHDKQRALAAEIAAAFARFGF